jgi:hypothetical protein
MLTINDLLNKNEIGGLESINKRLDLTKVMPETIKINGIRYFKTIYKLQDYEVDLMSYINYNGTTILTLLDDKSYKEQIFIPNNRRQGEYIAYLNVKFYEDYKAERYIHAKVPNIYINGDIDLNVKLDIKQGQLTISKPSYVDGWNVNVKDGMINNKYTYLFYELLGLGNISVDKNIGWYVAKDDMAYFLNDALNKYGLMEREKNDFLDSWLKILDDNYCIYPLINNDIDNLVEIKLDKDVQINRLWFVFEKCSQYKALKNPDIKSFEREKINIFEWGGFII